MYFVAGNGYIYTRMVFKVYFKEPLAELSQKGCSSSDKPKCVSVCLVLADGCLPGFVPYREMR